ncbi:hypothetical protein Peur_046313 [Populus x canadensis]
MGWSTHLSRSRQNLVKTVQIRAKISRGLWFLAFKFLNHQLFSSILDSHQDMSQDSC